MTWNEPFDAFLATHRSHTGSPDRRVPEELANASPLLSDNQGDHTARRVDHSVIVGIASRNAQNFTTRVRFSLRAASQQLP